MKKIKVLIVEDSKTMSEWIANILAQDDSIEVVGKALDPFMARDLIKKTNPDVITLDIIMPKMDGITFLKNLMRLHPLPVVMISSLTDKGSVVALEALALGAIDYIPKPTQQEYENNAEYSKTLINSIHNATKAKVGKLIKSTLSGRAIEHIIYHSKFLTEAIIAIGGSTGGIEAIESILSKLPKTFPGIVISQHIRQEFSGAFAKRINKLYRLNVKEAEEDEEIVPGTVYIAPGGRHLCIKCPKKRYYCALDDGDPILGHKPSVDVLFNSVAKAAGKNAVAIILTGMGEDGAKGAKAIREAGGTVIAQDEESSVVWGMPGSAVKENAVNIVAPLEQIPETLFRVLDEYARRSEDS